MSMLNFYINRAGRNLVLERAKKELRKAFSLDVPPEGVLNGARIREYLRETTGRARACPTARRSAGRLRGRSSARLDVFLVRKLGQVTTGQTPKTPLFRVKKRIGLWVIRSGSSPPRPAATQLPLNTEVLPYYSDQDFHRDNGTPSRVH